MIQQGVCFLLFKKTSVAIFTFSLQFLLKVLKYNWVLLLKIVLTWELHFKFNFGSKYIKNECNLLSWYKYFSGNPLLLKQDPFLPSSQVDLGWVLLGFPLLWTLVPPAPGEYAIFFPILGKLWLLNQLKFGFPSPTALTNTIPVSHPSRHRQSRVSQLLRWV